MAFKASPLSTLSIRRIQNKAFELIGGLLKVLGPKGVGLGRDAIHADLVLLRAGDGRPGPQAEAGHRDGAKERQGRSADGWLGEPI